jgi:hypothetical protein
MVPSSGHIPSGFFAKNKSADFLSAGKFLTNHSGISTFPAVGLKFAFELIHPLLLSRPIARLWCRLVMKNSAFIVLGLFCLAGVGIAGWYATLPPGESELLAANEPQATETVQQSEPAVVPDSNMASIGGVDRPKSDVRLDGTERRERPMPKKRMGHSPFLAPDTNEQVTMVSEALKTRDKPERFSSFAVPHNFDAAKFEEAPQVICRKLRGDCGAGESLCSCTARRRRTSHSC